MEHKFTHHGSPPRTGRNNSGNVFFLLFASVALVGAFGVGASNIMKGMVASMSDVTRKTIAEERMTSAARLAVQNPAETGPGFGECGDGDAPITLANGMQLNFIEPLQYRDAGSLLKPTGGGLIPENIGAATRDPWGTQYGYCAWNPGSGTSCSDGTTRRLQGGTSPSQTVVAVISAGKDRKFSTTCAAISGPTSTPADCSGLGSDHHNDAGSGHCYFQGSDTRDFAGAAAACQAAGGYLAAITSSAENNMIVSNFTGGDLWFGASDSVDEGVWKITGGESAGQQFWQGNGAGNAVGGRYNNWSGGEPNSAGTEDCAIVSTAYSSWNDVPCNAVTGYICEKSPGPPPSPITKAAGSDDIVMEFSYDQLRGLGGEDLWKVQDTKPDTQTIDKNIEVTGGASFSGAINLMREGLLLPTDPGDNSVTGACGAPNAEQMRLNSSTSPLSLEICHSGAWVPISMGASAPAAGSIPAGAVAHWKFEEGTGTTVADATGNNNTGTLRNGAVFAPGRNGGGASMDATNDYMEAANEANFDFDYTQDWTLSGWFEVDGTPEREFFFKGVRDNQYRGIRVWVNESTRQLAMSLSQQDGGTYANSLSDQPIPASGWHHYTIVYKGTTSPGGSGISMYIDGAPIGSTPGGYTLYSTILNNAPFGVGSYEDGYGVDGGVDEVVIYNRALSAAEVSQLHTGTLEAAGPAGPKVASNFNPMKANCIAANSGPFTEAAVLTGPDHAQYFHRSTTLNGKTLKGRSSVNGLAVLNVSGGSFSTGPGTNDGYYGPTNDGKYVYAANGSGVRAYSFDGTALTSLATYSASNAWSVYADGKYVYVLRLGDGLDVLSFDGTAFTLKAHYAPGGSVGSAFSDGKYLYIAIEGVGLRAATFDGTTLNVLATFNANSNETVVAGDGRYIYLGAYTDDLYALTFDGTAFTVRGHYVADGSTSWMVTDGVHVFFANDTALYGNDVLYAAKFDGSTFNIVGSYKLNGSGNSRNLWFDGRYVYFDNYLSKLVALSGFECTKASSRAGVVNADTVNLPSGLLGYWKFDEASGTAANDSSGNGTSGTLTGGASRAGGISGSAVSITSSAQYVEFGSPASLDNNIRSMCAWVSPTDITGTIGIVMGKTDDNTIGPFLYVHSNYGLGGWNSESYKRSTGGIVPQNNWSHICQTWTGSAYTPADLKIYKNGMEVTGLAASASGSAKDDAALNFRIGRASSGSSYFRGLVDEAMVFDRPLSGQEVLGIYNTTLGGGSLDREPNPAVIVAANKFGNRLTVGDQITCAIWEDGTAGCAGLDSVGQLGNGAGTASKQRLSRVTDPGPFTTISASSGACALKSDGSAWCWGEAANGRLGNNTTSPAQQSPVAVSGGHVFSQLSTGLTGTCGVRIDGRLLCWGGGGIGGSGNGADRLVPTLATDVGPWVSVSVGHGTSCAIKANGSLWCAGSDQAGTLGNDPAQTSTQSYVPVAEPGPWNSVAVGRGVACATKLDGSLWCWGDNTYGTVGNGTTGTDAFLPVRVPDRGPWLKVGSGLASYTMCGVKIDGSGWCWGRNNSNQMGLGATTANVTTPKLVSAGPWASLIGGVSHSCGLMVDGSAWCAGNDGAGRLGNGTTLGNSNVMTRVADYPLPAAFTWDSTQTTLTAAGSGNLAISGGAAIGYDGTRDANAVSNGLRFDTGGQTVLRQGGGSAALTSTIGGLVARWALDESTGTTATDSVGGLNGTLANTPTWQPTGGAIGGALSFNGSNQSVQVPRAATIEPGKITLSAWVKLTGTHPTNAAVLIKPFNNGTGPTYNSYGLYLNGTNDQMGFFVGGSADFSLVGTQALPQGVWHFVTATYDPEGSAPQQKIYLNGVLAGSATRTAPIVYGTSNSDFFIGNSAAGNGGWNGSIDDVRVYDRALTQSEITAMLNDQRGVYNAALKLSTGGATTSSQLSLKAASAANPRSIGVDYATGSLEFGLNNTGVTSWMHAITPQMEISTSGNVGVGTSGTPAAKLDITGGGLRVGNDTGTCFSARSGTLRFVGGSTPFEYCNGSAWVAF